jgi:drug/metabolite transporter (DMT)-like permease
LMALVSAGLPEQRYLPMGIEWLWLLLLSQVCTVWAFSASVALMRRVGVFFISLTANLEPLWGMLLAWCVLGEYRQLTVSFWIGAALVLGSVAVYPLFQNRGKASLPCKQEGSSDHEADPSGTAPSDSLAQK